MADLMGVERLARTWMIPEDSVSIFSAAHKAEEIRRKHNAFVQAVVTKVSNLEQEVKRMPPVIARGPDDELTDVLEAPSIGDLGRIVVLESKVDALEAENDHLAAQVSASAASARDDADVMNKLRYLKRENESLAERQDSMEDQLEQLARTVAEMADRSRHDRDQLQASQKSLFDARAEIGRLRDRVRVLEHGQNIPRPSATETKQRIDMHDSRITWLESSLGKRR